MLDYLNMVGTAIFVVFFFGFCVFIHELGHFLAAKWRGLHIVAFSIGFKKIWGYEYKGVDYRIGCLPFGGYVDLPQIDSTGEAEDENGKPLPRVKPIDRIIVAFAGPLFNVIFGLFLGVFIWVYGVPEASPRMDKLTVSEITVESPEYEAGLRKGDIITKINDNKFYFSWSKFMQEILFTVGDIKLTIQKDGKEKNISYTPIENPNLMGKEGLAFPFFKIKIPVVLYPKPNSPAEKAGVKGGDKLIAIDGINVEDQEDGWLRSYIYTYAPKTVNLIVERNKEKVEIKNVTTIPIGEKRNIVGIQYNSVGIMKINDDTQNFKKGDIISVSIDGNLFTEYSRLKKELKKEFKGTKEIAVNITRGGKELEPQILKLSNSEKENFFSLSIIPAIKENTISISKVIKDGAAEIAGIQKGDSIIKMNGKTVKYTEVSSIIATAKNAIKVTVLRENKEVQLEVTPKNVALHTIGVKFNFINHPTPVQQLKDVVRMSYLSLRGIFAGLGKKMGITKNGSSLKPRHLSGPLGIVDTIGTVVYRGSYLLGINFIVMITFSLGILNLLPLPVLDGGHITIASIEILIRKRLHEKSIEVISTICIVFLLSFMLFVTFHDSFRFVTKHFIDDTENISLHLSK